MFLFKFRKILVSWETFEIPLRIFNYFILNFYLKKKKYSKVSFFSKEKNYFLWWFFSFILLVFDREIMVYHFKNIFSMDIFHWQKRNNASFSLDFSFLRSFILLFFRIFFLVTRTIDLYPSFLWSSSILPRS